MGQASKVDMQRPNLALSRNGNAASHHDWEFRTILRVELLESQETAMRKASGGHQEEVGPYAQRGGEEGVKVKKIHRMEAPKTPPSLKTISTPGSRPGKA